jgi:hypothetical protein
MALFNRSCRDGGFMLEAISYFLQSVFLDFAFLVNGLKSHIPKDLAQKRRTAFTDVPVGVFILAGLIHTHVQSCDSY